MAQFILFDHSLWTIGGHHFRYAVQYSQAAVQAGYEPVLATHRSFSRPSDLPESWRVLPVFRHTGYARYRLGIDGISQHAIAIDGRYLLDNDRADARGRRKQICMNFWIRLCDLRWIHGRRRRIVHYAQDLAAAWQEIEPRREDCLFLPTITDYDMIGLVRKPWRARYAPQRTIKTLVQRGSEFDVAPGTRSKSNAATTWRP